MALGAEEGRGKLRKAAGRSKHSINRGYPNGETHMVEDHVSYTEVQAIDNRYMRGTARTETSK